jgi:hypothetical protein
MCFGKTQTVDAKYYGPFGESKIERGPGMRDYIYDQLISRRSEGANNRAAVKSGIMSAVGNQAMPEAVDLARRQIRGDYLGGGPELTAGLDRMQSAAERYGADEEAAAREGMSRAGVGFSTAAQQGQQSARAARRAQMGDVVARTMATNYQNERQIQQQSPQMASQALSQPLEWLGNLNPNLYNDLGMEGDLTMKMAGGGTTATPTVMQKPGLFDYAMGVLGMI